jgi:hypothetical protein
VPASKILPTISPIYWVNPSISWLCVEDIFSYKKKWEKETCENVKWLKGAKIKTLRICYLDRMVNVKNETATNKVTKKQAKVLSQQMSVINFIHKNKSEFCSKNETIINTNIV